MQQLSELEYLHEGIYNSNPNYGYVTINLTFRQSLIPDGYGRSIPPTTQHVPYIRFTTDDWKTYTNYNGFTTRELKPPNSNGFYTYLREFKIPIFKKCVFEYAICFTPQVCGAFIKDKQEYIDRKLKYWEYWDNNNKNNYKLVCEIGEDILATTSTGIIGSCRTLKGCISPEIQEEPIDSSNCSIIKRQLVLRKTKNV